MLHNTIPNASIPETSLQAWMMLTWGNYHITINRFVSVFLNAFKDHGGTLGSLQVKTEIIPEEIDAIREEVKAKTLSEEIKEKIETEIAKEIKKIRKKIKTEIAPEKIETIRKNVETKIIPKQTREKIEESVFQEFKKNLKAEQNINPDEFIKNLKETSARLSNAITNQMPYDTFFGDLVAFQNQLQTIILYYRARGLDKVNFRYNPAYFSNKPTDYREEIEDLSDFVEQSFLFDGFGEEIAVSGKDNSVGDIIRAIQNSLDRDSLSPKI
ncbi:hypothetical protein [Legionella norrlandica]|nr:hypothetical protein [Legionella norrlandica]